MECASDVFNAYWVGIGIGCLGSGIIVAACLALTRIRQ